MFSKTETIRNQLDSKHSVIDNTKSSVETNRVTTNLMEHLPNLTKTNSDTGLAAGNDKSHTSLGMFSRSEENISIEENDESRVAMSKKVRFSQPLEFWKEFDTDKDLLDWNYNAAKLQQSKEDEMRRRKFNDKIEKNGKEKRRNRGKPLRTITEAVQAFQIEDEKTSVRKFIAHYKRTSVNIPTSRVIHRKVHNTVISEFEKIPSDTMDNDTDGNGGICELCNSNQTELYCEQHQQQTLNTSSNLQMQNVNSFTTLNPVVQRTPKLPTRLYNGRKLFDERLLPHTENHNNDFNYGYLKSDYRGIPSVQRTPFIVQLFE